MVIFLFEKILLSQFKKSGRKTVNGTIVERKKPEKNKDKKESQGGGG